MTSSKVRIFFSTAVIMAIAGVPSLTHAQYGPFADFRASIDQVDLDASSMFDTGCLFACGTPWAKFGIRDRVNLAPNQNFSGPVDVGGFVVLTGDVDVATGTPINDWTFTTFYGIDANPQSADEDMTLTGFDAVDPPLAISEETFIGNSQDYLATSLGPYAIQDLSAEPLFDGFDFSAFVGDPSSIVYAFQATVPISDFDVQLVPEPSVCALLLTALLAATATRTRQQH
ncbi:MAG: hypothetical protein AAGD11_07320 [Planctomycetota bacterium]